MLRKQYSLAAADQRRMSNLKSYAVQMLPLRKTKKFSTEPIIIWATFCNEIILTNVIAILPLDS